MILLGAFKLLTFSLTQNWLDVSTPEYVGLLAKEKKEVIWENCVENTSSAPWFNMTDMTGLFLESMCPVIRLRSDQMPWESSIILGGGWRQKFIHTVGVVGQVEWINRGGHSYTGVFEGAKNAIIRLSFAREPDTSSLTTVPGLGLKILRDKMDSANLVAMFSVLGQQSWNYFKNDFKNHIPPLASPENLAVGVKFSEATKFIQQVGLSHWSTHKENGEAVSNPVFPYCLRFHPTGDISFSDTYVRPFTEDLMSIPSGSTLYEVWALDKPTELGGVEAHIADLVLTSEVTTSLWGDQHLFFHHQDMHEDINLVPEWRQYTPTFGPGLSRCPFEDLIQGLNVTNLG